MEYYWLCTKVAKELNPNQGGESTGSELKDHLGLANPGEGCLRRQLLFIRLFLQPITEGFAPWDKFSNS